MSPYLISFQYYDDDEEYYEDEYYEDEYYEDEEDEDDDVDPPKRNRNKNRSSSSKRGKDKKRARKTENTGDRRVSNLQGEPKACPSHECLLKHVHGY